MLGKIEEAISLLDPFPSHVGALNGCYIPSTWSLDGRSGASLSEALVLDKLAHISLAVNKAAVKAQEGDLDWAQRIFEEVLSKCPIFVPAIKGLAYVMVKKGRARAAANLLLTGLFSRP